MSDFVPPTRVELDVSAQLKALYGENQVLVKDLTEGQILCTTCGGLGLQMNDFRFGLRSEGDPIQHPMFPYHEQAFGPCGACYTGVQTLCKHCGKPYPRGYTQCTCDGCCKERSYKLHEKELERQTHCKRIPYAEYTGEAMYDDDTETFIYDGDSTDLEPGHTYFACKGSKGWVGIDKADLLDNIKERAEQECEDGGDMVDWSPEAEAELEKYLLEWFEKNVSVSEAYWPDRSTIVVVSPQDCGIIWDEDGDEYEDGEEKKLFECAEEGCTMLLHPSKVGEAPQRCKKHTEAVCAPLP